MLGASENPVACFQLSIAEVSTVSLIANKICATGREVLLLGTSLFLATAEVILSLPVDASMPSLFGRGVDQPPYTQRLDVMQNAEQRDGDRFCGCARSYASIGLGVATLSAQLQ